MEVSGRLHAPAALPPVPTVQEDEWAPKPNGRHVEEKNVLLLPVIKPRPLGRPARSIQAIPTALSRLSGVIVWTQY
jgi:hypothetical protein